MGSYLILVIIPMALSWYVGYKLKSKFKEYSQTPLANNMSGEEVAKRMLADNGISDVKVVSVRGRLTDHYNPMDKTVNLSEAVFHMRNAAAAAVAAHECGHALQHAKGYSWLQLRSKLVPAVQISSRFLPWVLMGGIFTIQIFPQLLLLGILLFAATTVFSIVTLPVEYDASNRALAWIKSKHIVTNDEFDMAEDALRWAARTYLVGAIASIGTLLYYVMIYMGRRD